MLNVDSVEWFEPFLTVPTKQTVLKYDRNSGVSSDRIKKITCDLSRVCEVEDCVAEWYDKEWFSKLQKIPNFDLTEIQKYFKVVKFDCATSDGVVFKLHLQAENPGKLLIVIIYCFV